MAVCDFSEHQFQMPISHTKPQGVQDILNSWWTEYICKINVVFYKRFNYVPDGKLFLYLG